MIRRAIHAALNAIGVVTWLIAWAAGAATVWLSILGHRIWPDADVGNCWTYALPRWWKSGGHLAIHRGRLRIGPIWVPHAIWVRGAMYDTHQTEPVRRRRGALASWLGLASLRFRFTVRSGVQASHRAARRAGSCGIGSDTPAE